MYVKVFLTKNFINLFKEAVFDFQNSVSTSLIYNLTFHNFPTSALGLFV